MAESTVRMPDGTVRPLSSFTEEERTEMRKILSARISRVIEEYVRCHPEQYDQIVEALRNIPGAKIENE